MKKRGDFNKILFYSDDPDIQRQLRKKANENIYFEANRNKLL